MSINSKARRDAKKRKAQKERNLRQANAPKVEGHAELRNQAGELVAGIVRRGHVWFLGMDGRMAGSSDSAAEVFALLKRVGKTCEAEGMPVRMVYSDELRDTAVIEAAAQGLTLDEYDAKLEAEIALRGEEATQIDAPRSQDKAE
ncbi:MAG: hypothetical protein QM769_08380 [Pseudoxanthomonas sp.]